MLFLAGLCLFLLAFGAGVLNSKTVMLESELKSFEQQLDYLQEELWIRELQLKINQHQLEVNRHLLEELTRLRQENQELHQRMKQWLDTWEVDIWESSAYAPLDPRAVEGWDYEGDPRVTASGAKLIPYVTAAARPSIPFGTPVWIDAYGWRVIQDRGARVGKGSIDLAVMCQDEANKMGREPVKVVYPK